MDKLEHKLLLELDGITKIDETNSDNSVQPNINSERINEEEIDLDLEEDTLLTLINPVKEQIIDTLKQTEESKIIEIVNNTAEELATEMEEEKEFEDDLVYEEVEFYEENKEYFEEEEEEYFEEEEEEYFEEEEEDFESFDVQLHNPKFWDDSELIKAWDRGVKQRDEAANNPIKKRKVKKPIIKCNSFVNETKRPEEKIKPTISGRIATFDNLKSTKLPQEPIDQVTADQSNVDPIKLDQSGAHHEPTPTVPIMPTMAWPHADLSGSERDRDLLNMQMGYYFAGYYAGIYQAKHQGPN